MNGVDGSKKKSNQKGKSASQKGKGNPQQKGRGDPQQNGKVNQQQQGKGNQQQRGVRRPHVGNSRVQGPYEKRWHGRGKSLADYMNVEQEQPVPHNDNATNRMQQPHLQPQRYPRFQVQQQRHYQQQQRMKRVDDIMPGVHALSVDVAAARYDTALEQYSVSLTTVRIYIFIDE